MYSLKLIGLTITQAVKHVCLLPREMANAVRSKRRQTVLDEREAERLDRIRNPFRYLGK